MKIKNNSLKTPLFIGRILINPQITAEIDDDVYKNYIKTEAGKYYSDKFLVKVKDIPIKQALSVKKKIKDKKEIDNNNVKKETRGRPRKIKTEIT